MRYFPVDSNAACPSEPGGALAHRSWAAYARYNPRNAERLLEAIPSSQCAVARSRRSGWARPVCGTSSLTAGVPLIGLLVSTDRITRRNFRSRVLEK